MQYKLTQRPYLKAGSDVTIVQMSYEVLGRYSFEKFELDGDWTTRSDEEVIAKCVSIMVAEIDPASTLISMDTRISDNIKRQKTLEDLSKELEKQSKQLITVSKIIAINEVMSKTLVYGTAYAAIVELFPDAVVGKQYDHGDIIVINDPTHTPVNGEGTKVLVEINKQFTYNGEPVSDFVTNGRLEQNGFGLAWKFEPKE